MAMHAMGGFFLSFNSGTWGGPILKEFPQPTRAGMHQVWVTCHHSKVHQYYPHAKNQRC